MNEATKQKIMIVVIAYFVGFSLLGVGFFIGTTQVTNNYYYEPESRLTVDLPNSEPICESCYLSLNSTINFDKSVTYYIHLDNLTINHTYWLIFPQDYVLFTYLGDKQMFPSFFDLTYLATPEENITIQLYEFFVHPFVYKGSELKEENLLFLDILVISLDI